MKKEIQDTIKVEYHLGDTDEKIERKSMAILYGRCCSYGYIIPGSFEILKRSPPVLTNMENGGKMYIMVKFQASVVTLQKGEVVEGRILKVTPKLGASASIIVDGATVADVILPNDMQTPGVKIKEGENMDIKIMISSYGVGWERIRGVGIVVGRSSSKMTDNYEETGLNHSELRNIRVINNAEGGKIHVS
jgi:DNA-directed RNA polymerase subunit E'/Rpb7